MDPEACLDAAESALQSEDLDTASERLADYKRWRSREGFEPEGGDKREKDLRTWLIEARKMAVGQAQSVRWLASADMFGSIRQHYRLEVERIAQLAWRERDEDGNVDDESIAEPCQRSPWTGDLAALTWHATDHREAAEDMGWGEKENFHAVVCAAACYAMIEDVRAALPEATPGEERRCTGEYEGDE